MKLLHLFDGGIEFDAEIEEHLPSFLSRAGAVVVLECFSQAGFGRVRESQASGC